MEIIKEEDMITWHTKKGKYAGMKNKEKFKRNIKRNERNYKSISRRSIGRRMRCFKCGHYEGQWIEVFIKGRWTYHFLCNECSKEIK